MKLIRLSFLLMCCFLMSTFQANAQCGISNLTISATTCDNVMVAAGVTTQDVTYCGTFTAASTSGNYSVQITDALANPLGTQTFTSATDGTVSFCITFSFLSDLPRDFSVFDTNDMVCGEDILGPIPSPCPASPACDLTGLSISRVCCDGNGGLRVAGNFTAANGSSNYRLVINGIAAGGGFPAQQTADIQNAGLNGVVNFDVTIPTFNFGDVAGGIFIQDNLFGTCTSNTINGLLPANAGACTSCTPAVAQAPIPTMSQWGLLIFGLLVLNLGVIFLYRKQSQFIK